MAVIAIFIPHSGCRNECVFCNQKSITGKAVPPSIEETRNIIEENLKTFRQKPQIAFFGGSFTGIGGSEMEGYLSAAQEYIDKGLVSSVRLSTRPDYIDPHILDILQKYSVRNIELGAQSMDDEVLKLSGRGHDSEAVRRASRLIKERGITLGLQMMTGLPGDSFEKSLYTAEEFVRLGAEETRIYPTVVITKTKLSEMMASGEYVPDTLDEAIEKAAMCYEVFYKNHVKVLRIGLQNSEGLKKEAVGGAYHDSLGELVFSRVIRRAAEKAGSGEIRFNAKMTSKVIGQKRSNLKYFEENDISVSLIKDENVSGVTVNGKYVLTI